MGPENATKYLIQIDFKQNQVHFARFRKHKLIKEC